MITFSKKNTNTKVQMVITPGFYNQHDPADRVLLRP